MSFTNSAIRGATVTLPSVEGGFGSLNILRDPPRSIVTTYKPKVSDTSKLAEWIDGSGDRVCESIQVYSRGVNPMVSVSYSNNGSNGGQYRDWSGQNANPTSFGNGQSYLPYRVNREGAFRPPVIPPEQLLPLSRLPKLPTSQYTNLSGGRTIDLSELTKCSVDLKSLRADLLQVCAPPRAIFNIETPASKPYEVDNMINNKTYSAVDSNKNNNTSYTLGINKNPERGIKTEANTLHGSIPVSVYKNIQATPITGFCGNQPLHIQDRIKGSLSTNVSGVENTQYIHSDVRLDRNRPMMSVQSNPNQCGVDLNGNVNARTYLNLPQRVSRGGFTNQGCAPTSGRQEQTVALPQQSIYQKAAEQALIARSGSTW